MNSKCAFFLYLATKRHPVKAPQLISGCFQSSKARQTDPRESLKITMQQQQQQQQQQQRGELEMVLQDPILVLPQLPTPKHSLYLSLLDRQAPYFMYTLYFYDRSESKDSSSVFEELKLAMEKCLVPHFPAAGRIQNNHETGEPQLFCNAEGVLLVEASTGAKIADLGDLRQADAELEKFIHRVAASPTDPLVVCQITRCGCGGFVVGVGCRHDLFDGLGSLRFQADWASLSRGIPLEEIQVPFHSREPLRSKVSKLMPAQLESHLSSERFQGIPLFQIPTDKKARAAAAALMPKCQTKVFSISTQMISQLKGKAMEGGHLRHCSTFDVLTAHAWIARIKATGICPSERVLLEFTVNGRPKTVPPLPEDFTGNAFIMGHKNCSSAEILNSPFHAIVKMIQDTKASVTDSFICDSLSTLGVVKTRSLPSFRETTIVADWTRIPFSTLDFGWGAPIAATPVAMPIQDVVFLLRDGLEGGGICLRLGLLPQVMEEFEKHIYEIMYSAETAEQPCEGH